MRRTLLAATLAATPTLAFTLAAFADDAPLFVYGGEFSAKVQSDFTSVNRSKPRVNLFTDADLSFWANHGSWLTLNGDIKFDRSRNANQNSYFPDRSGAFRSETATLHQLSVTIRPIEGLSFTGGKIHPAFGSGYEETPGQFYSFATDYEQDERIGLGIEYQLPAALGLGELSASFEMFYLDTSFLSGSFPRGPSLNDVNADRTWRYTRGQFGPSNTGSLASWTAAVKGGKAGSGLSWQISVTRQATVEPGTRAESGQSASISYDPTGSGIAITPRFGVTPFVEYAHFTNFQTVAGLERHYLVGGLAFKTGPWELDLAAGSRTSRGAQTGTDHQESITLTYEILPGFQAGAGINHITSAGRGSWALAPALNYKVTF